MPKKSRAQNSSRASASQMANANMPRSRVRHARPQARYATSSTSVSDWVAKPQPSASSWARRSR